MKTTSFVGCGALNAALCGCLLLLFVAPSVDAASIAWDTRTPMAAITARDLPLRDFMEALVAPQSLTVVVSPAAMPKLVNGRFSGNPQRAFETVVRSLSLLPYYDGGTLYIFTGAEIQRRTVNLTAGSAERVIQTLSQLRLHDGRYNVFTAVPASGLLQVAGAKPFVDQVQEVVRSVQLSAAASPEQIGIFPLKHAWAWDVTLSSAGRQIVVPGIASLLRTLLSKNGVVSVAGNTRTRASVPKLRGRGLAAGADADAAVPPAPGDAPSRVDDGDDLMRGGGTGAGGPTVTAEVRTNSVVVRDTPDRLPQYAELIRSLDVEPVMVELEATIVDINADNLEELGVNWRIGNGTNELRFGRGDSSDLGLRGPDVSSVFPIGRGLGWSTVRDSARLIARITALAATGNARVVSRAQVSTLANLEASISSNETAYVRVGGFQDVDLFPVSAATSVRITPQVFTRGDRQIVSMVVSIRDGRFTPAVVDQIPSVKELVLSTNGLVADSQTFVIGGFKQESSSKRADKIPLLGDIPVIGNLFKTTTDQVTNGERLFLLTPRVLTVASLLERPNAELPVPASAAPARASPLAPAASRSPECVEPDPAACFPHVRIR